MFARVITLFALALSMQSCCGCPEQEKFSRMSLDEKIGAIRQNTREGCGCEGGWSWYMEEIAKHGDAAISAMLPLLDDHDKYFRASDAVSVLRYANRLHYDARAALQKLEELALHGRDSSTRQGATAAVREITAPRWSRGS